MRTSRLAADRLRCSGGSGGIELLWTKIACVEGLPEAFGSLTRWLVLRYEILGSTRHAVIVGPAIHHRQGRAEVAVLRRGVRGLPLQSRCAPGIGTRRLAFE